MEKLKMNVGDIEQPINNGAHELEELEKINDLESARKSLEISTTRLEENSNVLEQGIVDDFDEIKKERLLDLQSKIKVLSSRLNEWSGGDSGFNKFATFAAPVCGLIFGTISHIAYSGTEMASNILEKSGFTIFEQGFYPGLIPPIAYGIAKIAVVIEKKLKNFEGMIKEKNELFIEFRNKEN
jgi:hypothetical protein